MSRSTDKQLGGKHLYYKEESGEHVLRIFDINPSHLRVSRRGPHREKKHSDTRYGYKVRRVVGLNTWEHCNWFKLLRSSITFPASTEARIFSASFGPSDRTSVLTIPTHDFATATTVLVTPFLL